MIRVTKVSGTIRKVQIEAICRGKKGVERAAGAGGGGVGLDAMDIADPEDGEEEDRVVEAQPAMSTRYSIPLRNRCASSMGASKPRI